MYLTLEDKGPLNKFELFIIVLFSYKFWNQISSNNLLWFLILIWILYSLPIVLFFLFLIRNHSSIKLKFPFLSFLLSYSHFFVFAFEIVFIALLGPKFILFFSKTESLYYFKTISVVLSIPFIIRFLVLNKILKIAKLFVNNFYSILVFRRFKTSKNFRSTILPTLGSYGEISSVFDENLNKSDSNPVDYFYGKILSNEKEYRRLNKNDWKNEVIRMIEYSELIIFYWSETPTRSMLWELEETKRQKKINNVLFILEDASHKRIIERFLKDIPSENVILFNRSSLRKRFYKFIICNKVLGC